MNFFVPPLQSPDELNHFYRAYQVSEGQFPPIKKDQRLGGYMPVCFKQFASTLETVSGNEYYRISRQELMGIFDIKFETDRREFKDFPNTANYSPVSYLPQALAMFIMRQFDVSVGSLYYSGRISIFLVWLISMFFAIRILPFYKWTFAVLIMLPMNIYISNSFSADTVTNILSFLLITITLKHALGDENVGLKHLLVLLVLGILLANAKILYAALILVLLIIPPNKFRDKKTWFFGLTTIFFATTLFAWLCSNAVMKYYIGSMDYNPLFRDTATLAQGSDYYLQMAYTLSHKGYLWKVFYHVFFDDPKYYICSYIGGFGTFLHLFLPTAIYLPTYAVIIFVVVAEGKKLFTVFQRFVFFLTACVTLFLLVLSQHLTWNLIGQVGRIYLQGRYLIPIFPLLFLLFGGTSLKINLKIDKAVMIFIIFLNTYAIYFLYNAYIKDHHYSETAFFCGAEQTDGHGFFLTTNPSIKLEGAICQSGAEHRTGRYSVALTPGSAFSFTYRFKNFDKRDMIEVVAWQKGEGGILTVAGKGNKCGDFYFTDQNTRYEDKNGWKKMHMLFGMWQKCDGSEAGFFLHNPGNTTVYFDDVSFSIKKFRSDVVDPY